MAVVCVSTGGFHKLEIYGAQAVREMEKYVGLIDGIEIALATPKELFDFELDKKSLDILTKLKFNSVHMPFKDITYSDSKETEKLLEKASWLCKQIKSSNSVFHPNSIADYKLINEFSCKPCIENMDKKPKYTGYYYPKEIGKILAKNPELGLCIDTAHAWSNNINPTEFLQFKEKITSVHVNGQEVREGELKDHAFLVEEKKEKIQSIEAILKLKVPLVIEAHFFKEKQRLIKKEIELLKGY